MESVVSIQGTIIETSADLLSPTMDLKQLQLFRKDIHKDDLIEIALHSTLPIKSSVKEYHACEKMWTHVMNKKLDALMETNNKVDIYVVCVIKKMLLSASYL